MSGLRRAVLSVPLPDLLEPRGDQRLHGALRQWRINREVKSALGHCVTLELALQPTQDRPAERQVAEVCPERCQAGEDPALDTERGYAIGDHLLGVGDQREDRLTHRLQRAALGLIQRVQIGIDLLPGHGAKAYMRRSPPSAMGGSAVVPSPSMRRRRTCEGLASVACKRQRRGIVEPWTWLDSHASPAVFAWVLGWGRWLLLSWQCGSYADRVRQALSHC